MTPLRGREAIADLLNIPIARYPHDIFLDKDRGLRNTMTAYDAAFEPLPKAFLQRWSRATLNLLRREGTALRSFSFRNPFKRSVRVGELSRL